MADDGTVPTAASVAHGDGAEERARDKRFRREQAWFLRQVAVDVPECAAVAIALADHANRTSGLMFPSIATLARAIGRSPRAVQPHLARLERRGHIVFAGWVRLTGNANVKSWRWSLWDHRVELRFDQALIGDGRSGRNLHDRKPAAGGPVRKKAARPETARSGRNRCTGPEDSGVPVRKVPSDKPCSEPCSEPTTTTTSLLPLNGTALEREKDDDEILVEEIAQLHGYKPCRRTAKRWRGGFFEARIAGIDPRRHLLPAIQAALIEAARRGSARLDSTTDLLGRFEVPARQWMEILGSDRSKVADDWLRRLDEQSAAIIASRPQAPASPKAPSRKFSQREQDERRHKKRQILQAGSWPIALTSSAPWLTKSIELLEARGIPFATQIAAVQRANADRRLPRDLRAFKQSGGLVALVERDLERPMPSQMH